MRKIFNIILYLLFIIICLLLINTKCFATTFTYIGVEGSGFSQNDANDIETSFNNVKGNSQYYVLSCKIGERAKMCIFDNYNPPKFYVDLLGNSRIISSSTFSYRLYWLNGGGSTTYIGTYNNISLTTEMPFSYMNNLPMVFGNVPMYDDNSFTAGFWSPSNFSTPASIVNFSTQTYINNLIDGSFEYILVSSGSYAQYPVRFNINNGSSSDDTIRQKYIVLEHNGPYADVSVEPNQYQSYTIPKSDLIPIYNDTIYNMWLEYGEDFSIRTPIQTFTTDFSQSTIDNAVVDEQDATQQTAQNTEKIANELEQTNQFLTNDTINDADIDLPEISANDFTLSFFSTLVGSITDAFLDTTYDEVIEFDVRGEHYEIHSQQFNILGNVGLGYVKNFIALYWVFSIGYWIFCDARRRIYLMKEFKWTAMFADDISVKML